MVSFGVGTHYKTFNVYCDGVTRLFSTRLCNSPNDEIEGHGFVRGRRSESKKP